MLLFQFNSISQKLQKLVPSKKNLLQLQKLVPAKCKKITDLEK